MNNELKDRIKKLKNWLSEVSDLPKADLPEEDSCNNDLEVGSPSDHDLPIWFAAQRAVTSYKQLLSSAGPRGRLLGKLLTWGGFLPPAPEIQFELQEDDIASEPYLRSEIVILMLLDDFFVHAPAIFNLLNESLCRWRLCIAIVGLIVTYK